MSQQPVLPPSPPTTPWPRFVMLELTNACDLRCRHCPFHGDGVVQQRPIASMPKAMWQAVVDEIAGWNVALDFQPWGMGEPLLHPELWDVVAAASRHPLLTVGFYTNGNRWGAADVDAALESGLDWVSFSIDGVRPEVFEHYRVGARLDRVLANLRALHRARAARGGRGPEIRVNMTRYPELHDHDQEFLAALRPLADTIVISHFREVGVRRYARLDLPRKPCYQLDMMLPIAVDGRVGQCCEDQQVAAPVGRFPEQTLAAIWHGEILAGLRRAHREGRYATSPLCAECDGWTGIYEEVRETTRDFVVRERTAGTVYRARNAEAP